MSSGSGGEERRETPRVVDAQFETSGTEQLIEALRALSAGEPLRPPRRPRRSFRQYVVASLATIGVVTALCWWWMSRGGPPEASSVRGTLSLTADQPNVEIEIDGKLVGRAPLDLQLAPGVHVVEATSPTARVRETVEIQAGARRVLELELADTAQPATSLDTDGLDAPAIGSAAPAP